MIKPANRLHSVEEYYFSKKLREVATLKAQGKPIINLGIGSPDYDPPYSAIHALTESLDDVKAHQYQSYQGLLELRETISDFYDKHFDVRLSEEDEILPLMGSKEGIMHISMAYLNPGDEVLIPNPGYPTYGSVAKLIEAKPVLYSLTEENHWLPDILELERSDLSRVKLMWINYPHMPTGATAPNKVFEKLIAFAKRNSILIVNDNPYSFILNDYPRSILKYKGAKDCCLELNSISKTFNMAGWRVGMVLGKAELIQNILKVKSNMDSGMFYGVQKGAIEALKSSKIWYMSLQGAYKVRREIAWKLAEALNCTYDETAAGLFIWAKLPVLVESEKYIDWLLKTHSIFITPGTIFGSNGEGYIRISLCATTEELETALKRVS